MYNQMGRLEEAAACYRRALALDPNHAHAYSNLGNIFRGAGWCGKANPRGFPVSPYTGSGRTAIGRLHWHALPMISQVALRADWTSLWPLPYNSAAGSQLGRDDHRHHRRGWRRARPGVLSLSYNPAIQVPHENALRPSRR